MVDKKNNTQREYPKKQVINEKTILDDDNSKKSIIGWILVALLIVFIIVLTFLFRKDPFLESAKKYVEGQDIEITDELIIEAQSIEDEGYKTGLSEKCIKESYVLITKDEDGKEKYETKKICDDIEPTIELIGDDKVTINLNEKYKELGAKAELGSKDISDRIVIDSKELDNTKVGTYEIKYDIEDRYGNTASVTRSVEVIDNIPPVITLYRGYSISLYVGQVFNDPGYIATDNVDGNITEDVKIAGEVNTSVVGTYTLTYSVKDKAGNETTVTRRVNVLAIPAPSLTLKGGNLIYHTVGTVFKEPGYNATDPIRGNISGEVKATGKVDVNKLGTYTLTYTVTGTNGVATITRLVKVIDNIAPVIKLPVSQKEVEIYEGESYNHLLTAIVTDNFDSTPSLLITHNVNNAVAGTYKITYTATDASGNKTVSIIIVKVLSKTDAKIILNGNSEITYIIGTSGGFVDPGYIAIDMFNNDDITHLVTESGDTIDDSLTPGTYSIIYSVTGASGNVITKTRIVNVREVVSIAVITPPIKLTYKHNETSLDITGIEVNATLDDGSIIEVAISDINVVNFDSSTIGTNIAVTIGYLGETTTFDITVVEDNGEFDAPTFNGGNSVAGSLVTAPGGVVGPVFDTTGYQSVTIEYTAGADAVGKNIRTVISNISGPTGTLQLLAKDSVGNWYDIAVTGWGPPSGSLVDSSHVGVAQAETIYIISDTAGTYEVTIDIVDASLNVLTTLKANVIID